ncbi:hypothetical protein [Rubrivivax gelatinosus]|uniref:hypothetical protein n=1 Tax=Rubrivivax gelatinosus TaxID=28068 RepID=UPI001907B4C6|nr:hypothetical protein [Rubrivivax gelatinosus]
MNKMPASSCPPRRPRDHFNSIRSRARQPAILDLREKPPFAAGLFWAIDCVCKHWVFVSTQSRLELVIFSHDLATIQADEPQANRHHRCRFGCTPLLRFSVIGRTCSARGAWDTRLA